MKVFANTIDVTSEKAITQVLKVIEIFFGIKGYEMASITEYCNGMKVARGGFSTKYNLHYWVYREYLKAVKLCGIKEKDGRSKITVKVGEIEYCISIETPKYKGQKIGKAHVQMAKIEVLVPTDKRLEITSHEEYQLEKIYPA